MKKAILSFIIFIVSFSLIDLSLSFFLNKEIYDYINNKFELVTKEVSKKQMI
jgi:hypothetical protein